MIFAELIHEEIHKLSITRHHSFLGKGLPVARPMVPQHVFLYFFIMLAYSIIINLSMILFPLLKHKHLESRDHILLIWISLGFNNT